MLIMIQMSLIYRLYIFFVALTPEVFLALTLNYILIYGFVKLNVEQFRFLLHNLNNLQVNEITVICKF